MAIVERHTTPDGLLNFFVDLTDGDWSIGFDSVPAHTHGDVLAAMNGGSPESAVRKYVDDVVGSRRVIVISRIDGVIREAWVTDDPARDEMKYALPNETIEKRYWNGQTAAG